MSGQLSRSGWTTMKFGDVVRQCHETVDREDNQFDRYVEGGHMDSEHIHISRWGEFGSGYVGPAFHRIFRRGQVLYGSRRTYLKKVAVAEFDGITANTTFVLETKDPLVFSQDLLPFLMLTDAFTQHSVKESKGSTNPYITWPDIAKYEFALPPIEEQQHIADTLWACDRVLQAAESACNRSEQALLAAADSLCWSRCPDSGEIRQIADSAVGSFLDGDWIESKDQASGGVRLVQLADIGDGTFLDKSDRHISEATFDRLKCTEVFPGDILVSRMADPIGRACIVPQMGERMITAVDCTIVRVDKSRHSTQYWQYFMLSKRWKQLVQSRAGGSTRSRISRKNLETIQVPLPPLAVQKSMVADLDTIANVIKMASSYRDRSQSLAVCLRDQLLSSAISGELDV